MKNKNSLPCHCLCNRAFRKIGYSIFVLLAACGGRNSEEEIKEPPQEPVVIVHTSASTTLDWDWAEPAQAYCQAKEQEEPVNGNFEILRPETSDHLHPSEHFVLRWNNADGVNISQATIDAALQTFESVWDFYIQDLKFPEPYADTTQKYKVSVNVSNQGYASGAGTGLRDPEMWVHYDALAHIGTLAHEFAHTLQYTTRSMRDSQYVGWLWESHANWMAHLYNPTDVQCTEALANAPHIYYGSTRNRYCNWQFFEFVKDNSCPAFVNDALWKNGLQPEDPAHNTTDPFTTLANNTGWSTEQLNDIFGEWAAHNTHWDYQDSGSTYRSNYGELNDERGARHHRLTRLAPTDRTDEYEVPHYWAPQRWGYNVVELVPAINQTAIRLEFNGSRQDTPAVTSFPSGSALQPNTPSQANSSWRWTTVVTDKNGKPRYSEMQNSDSSSLTLELQEGDKNVWLVVMATPSKIQQIFWDQIYYSIYRYPWRIKIEGAKPAAYKDQSLTIAGVPHANGGGFVASTAQVANTVFVGSNARVLGNARITGNAIINDYAIIKGQAQISGDATVRGYAFIDGSATVSGSSIVEGHAIVSAGTIKDSARVGALTKIDGQNTVIGGNAIVETTMNTISGRTVNGSAQLYGDIELNTSVSKGVFYGYIDASIASDPSYGENRTQAIDEVTQNFNE